MFKLILEIRGNLDILIFKWEWGGGKFDGRCL